jgi:hypothetical protein
MSSITLIKIRLKNVNRELLKAVVEQLCKEYGGTMTGEISDYFGNRQKVEIGFKTPNFHRGVGFSVERGELLLKGDFFMHEQFQHELERRLTQTYTANAYVQSLRAMGFQTQTQRVGEKVTIKAFAW